MNSLGAEQCSVYTFPRYIKSTAKIPKTRRRK